MKQVFLFPFGKVINDKEQNRIKEAFEEFACQWKDHGEQVHMQLEFPYSSLLLIKAWKNSGGRIDGCAQDQLFRFVKQLGDHLQLPLLRFDLIPVIENQSVKFYTLIELRKNLQIGKISPQTPIVLFSVRKEEEWEQMPVPLKETAIYKQLIE